MDSDEYKKYKEQDYSMNAYVGKDGLENPSSPISMAPTASG